MTNASHAGTIQPGELETAAEEARSKWGWFVALGAALLVLGLLAFADVLLATLVSVLYIGIMMIVAAVAHIVEAFQVQH